VSASAVGKSSRLTLPKKGIAGILAIEEVRRDALPSVPDMGSM
jgi:hypothetical protein